MNEEQEIYNKLIQGIIKDKGGAAKDYRSLIDAIAFHESAGTMDPTIHQYSGGPGRGKYQFEGEGGSNRILTSANRTKKYLKSIGSPVPDYINEIIINGTGDASELSSIAQDILVLGDLRMKEGVDLGEYISGDLSIQDLWADHWWAGSDKLRDQRIKSFNKSLGKLTNSVIQNTPRQNTPIQNTNNLPFRQPSREIDATQVARLNQIEQNIAKQNVPTLNTNIQNTGASTKEGASSNVSLASYLNDYFKGDSLNEFNTGGTHQENPNGGIIQGIGANGKPNTVEENETSFDLPSGKFVFSDRISLDGESSFFSPSSNEYARGGKIDPPNNTVKTSKDFVSNWINDPITRTKLADNLRNYKEAQTLTNKGLDNISDTKTSQYKKNSGSTRAEYNMGNVSIYGEPNAKDLVHEYTHVSGLDQPLTEYINQNYGIPLKALRENQGVNNTDKAISQKFNIDDSTVFGKDKVKKQIEHARYIGRNGEIYPRIMEARQFLGLKPGQEVTDEDINKLFKSKNNDLINYYSKKQLKSMLNTIASNNNNQNYRNLV